MRLATKIVFGVSIGIVAIFAIMVATVLIIGINTMTNLEGESMDNSNEMGMGNEVKPWFGKSCDEMLDFSGSEQHNLMQDSMHIEFHEHYLQQCS